MRYELLLTYAETVSNGLDNDEINIFYSITGLQGLIIVKADFLYFRFNEGCSIIHLN